MVFTFFFNEVQHVDLGDMYDIDPYDVPKATHVRFVFESDTGLSVSVEEPTGVIDPDDNWLRIAVPMSKLKLPADVKEFRLKRLVIATDGPGTSTTPATMFLGEAKIVEDDQPIKVDPIGSQTIALGDEVVLLAEARGGVSSLKYSWDWDARNGIQDETVGKIGRCTYTKGGDYTITLTVSDVDGIKTPVSVDGRYLCQRLAAVWRQLGQRSSSIPAPQAVDQESVGLRRVPLHHRGEAPELHVAARCRRIHPVLRDVGRGLHLQ